MFFRLNVKSMLVLYFIFLLYSNNVFAMDIYSNSEAVIIFEEEEYESQIQDPFEKFNRMIFEFNRKVYQEIIYPLMINFANTKKGFIPETLRTFSDNLKEPNNILNSILQGNFQVAINSFWRFYINSILGLGGFFEIAESLGIKKVRMGFEDTMIYYGVEKGPYLILPFQYPTTLRGFFASILEIFVDPLFYIINDFIVSSVIKLILLIPERSEILDLCSGIDPYSKWRSIFYQREG